MLLVSIFFDRVTAHLAHTNESLNMSLLLTHLDSYRHLSTRWSVRDLRAWNIFTGRPLEPYLNEMWDFRLCKLNLSFIRWRAPFSKFLKTNKNSFKQFLLYSWWDKSKLRAEVFVPKTLGSFMLFVRPYLSVIDQTLLVVSSESYVRLYSTAPNQPLRVNSIQMCLKIQTRSYVLFSFKLTLI